MNDEDIQTVYDAMAEQIDSVGAENTELFLAKLSLLLAKATGDCDVALKCILDASSSLDS